MEEFTGHKFQMRDRGEEGCKRSQQESTKKFNKGGVVGWMSCYQLADGTVVSGQRGWRSEQGQ